MATLHIASIADKASLGYLRLVGSCIVLSCGKTKAVERIDRFSIWPARVAWKPVPKQAYRERGTAGQSVS
jgi:hypothetical protein